MQVKDHFRKNIHTISQDQTFRGALEKMLSVKTNGLIVIDSKGDPVGTVDSFILIKEAIPPYLSDNTNLAQYEPDDVLYKALSKVLNTKISKIMESLNGVRLQDTDSVIYAAALASKYDFRYIPVMNSSNKLIGLMSRTDVKRAMGEILGIKDDDNV